MVTNAARLNWWLKSAGHTCNKTSLKAFGELVVTLWSYFGLYPSCFEPFGTVIVQAVLVTVADIQSLLCSRARPFSEEAV